MQKRYFNYKDDDLTDSLNHWFLGIHEKGVYRGFDFSPTNDLNLTLVHTVSGYVETDKEGVDSNQLGLLLTTQGTIIKESESIILPVDTNAGNDERIDLIVLTHDYQDVVGGTTAQYSIIKGVPALEPTVPSLTSPETQIILGELHLPADGSVLNDAGVKFKKSRTPEFSGVVQKQAVLQRIRLDSYDTPTKALILKNKANRYVYDKESVNITPGAAVLDIELIEATPEGTEIIIESEEIDDNYSVIRLFLDKARVGNSVPIINSFNNFISDKSTQLINGNERLVLRSNGDSYSVVSISGRHKEFKGTAITTNVGKWTKIADYRIESQFASIRHEFDLHVVESGGPLIKRATILVNIKQQAAMSSPLEFANIVISNDIDFDITDIKAVVVTDNSGIKILQLFFRNNVTFSLIKLQENFSSTYSNRIKRLLSVQPIIDNVPAGVEKTVTHENDEGWNDLITGDAVGSILKPLLYKIIGDTLKVKGSFILTGTGKVMTTLNIVGINPANLGGARPIAIGADTGTTVGLAVMKVFGGANAIGLNLYTYPTSAGDVPVGIVELDGIEIPIVRS